MYVFNIHRRTDCGYEWVLWVIDLWDKAIYKEGTSSDLNNIWVIMDFLTKIYKISSKKKSVYRTLNFQVSLIW